MSNMSAQKIPLFPLTTVLFPQGILPLRIFEPRYLSMISDCMRNDSEFGVVLITQGHEAGEPAEFHQMGTLARIIDFDQLDDGFLGITCRGGSRFSVTEHGIEQDSLIYASIDLLSPTLTDHDELPKEFHSMKDFIKNLMKQEELKPWVDSIDPDWDSPDWLSYRLAEILPLSMESRQALLEMPLNERLSQIGAVMREHNLI